MKQLIIPALALPLLIVCCTKEASVQTPLQPSVVNVTAMSTGMNVSSTSFTANELVSVSYNVAGADSIQWNIQDSIPYYPDSSYTYPWPDSIVTYPGGDTVVSFPDTIPGYPGGDTIPPYPDGDTIPNNPWPDTIPTYPGGDTAVNYPGDDTLVNDPGNDTTLIYPGNDSTGNNGNNYVLTFRNKIADIRILKKGNYVLVANAYRHNANGTYTLISKGYVQLKAY